MKTKMYVFALFIAVVFFTNCNNPTKPVAVDNQVNNKIILTIGKVNVTVYEFEKSLNSFKEIFSKKNGHPPQKAEIQNLINDFIERTYFLADAFAKNYNNDKEINDMVNGAAHLMISQPHGLYEQTMLMGNNDPMPNDVIAAIEKSKKKIYIEYLKFKDEKVALAYLNNRIPANLQEFEKVANKSITDSTGIHRKEVLVWPFRDFGNNNNEYIYNLKVNQITPLLKCGDGYYVIHIENVEHTAQPQLSQQQMFDKLKYLNGQKVVNAYYSNINGKAQMQINENALKALNSRVKDNGLHYFVKKDFNELLQQSIMTYKYNDHPVNISVEQLMDFYNNLMFKTQIDDINSLRAYLRSMVFDDYIYHDAEKSGITRQTKFLLDENSYRNNLIYKKYEKEVLRGSSIDNDEINKEYDLTKNNFSAATDAVASFFYFKDGHSAFMGMMMLKRSIPGLQNLVDIKQHVPINYKDTGIPDTLKKVAFDLKNKAIGRPVPIAGNYVVILKESESGHRIKDLNEVRDAVIKQIEVERINKNKPVQLARLKGIYNIKNDIDYQKYIN